MGYCSRACFLSLLWEGRHLSWNINRIFRFFFFGNDLILFFNILNFPYHQSFTFKNKFTNKKMFSLHRRINDKYKNNYIPFEMDCTLCEQWNTNGSAYNRSFYIIYAMFLLKKVIEFIFMYQVYNAYILLFYVISLVYTLI